MVTLDRSSGLLLHPTSLPSPHGIGDLGAAAYRFVDFLAASHQTLWQILPLGPTGSGYSPYDARSSFAAHPVLVSVEWLVEQDLLEPSELASDAASNGVDFHNAEQRKLSLLRRAHQRLQARPGDGLQALLQEVGARESYWLNDYALYAALREAHGGAPWQAWETGLIHRDPATLERWSRQLEPDVDFHRFIQSLFALQWASLRAYANQRGVRILGDIPIYVSLDSADVWANQGLFLLDQSGRPTVVAGVPPDLFSSTGQRWGNPCYRWEAMDRNGYRWWTDRIRRLLEQCDIVRIDHFRAFQAGWHVPAEEVTAENGSWQPGPGVRLFEALFAELGRFPVVVEDLGTITDDVHELRERCGFPGMKVLQFAFGDTTDNPYLLHNHEPNSVVYTGTHDNDTTLGWYRNLSDDERARVQRYTGSDDSEVVWSLIRLALTSVARLCIIPLQDVLQLGSEARMNTPGVSDGNWQWRFQEGDLTDELAERLKSLTLATGRDPATTEWF